MDVCSITLSKSHTEWVETTKNKISNVQDLLNWEDELLHYFYNTKFFMLSWQILSKSSLSKKKKNYSTGCIWKNILYVNFKDAFYSEGAIQLHILQSRYLLSHWEGSLDLYGAIPPLLLLDSANHCHITTTCDVEGVHYATEHNSSPVSLLPSNTITQQRENGIPPFTSACGVNKCGDMALRDMVQWVW